MGFAADLGVLGNLAKALGLFDANGNPNQGWFAHPEDSLKNMLADPAQRAALIAFVDEAMGGAERSSEGGLTWLPIVEIDDPPLALAVTIDEGRSDGLHIGLGLRVSTTDPASTTTLALPLFRAHKQGGPAVAQPLLLGSAGGRIRVATAVTIAAGAPVPGQARLGGIGLEVDLPTSPADPQGPAFGVALTGLQLPGAAAPRDMRVSANSVDQLDDALLDLVMSLVKAQADAALAHPALVALAGLLGLRGGDAVPDFPIAALPARGALALADWVRGILGAEASRNDWLGHLAALLAGTRAGDAVRFDLGGAARLTLALRVASGPSGNPLLTPSLAIELGNDDARVEARADIFRVDLVSGAAFALPGFGVWAAAGRGGRPLLDIAAPTAVRADTLRLGFGLDAQRRLNFVLAADAVRIGTRDYATLDLSSPDAVMDAAGNAVEDIAGELLAGLGDALGLARQLLGLAPPAGVPAVTLAALMTDPVTAVAGYWRQLAADDAAARQVLSALRLALTDASEAVSVVDGDGSADAPWRLPLIGPLALEVSNSGDVLNIGLGAVTRVDTLGQRCTVVETRIAVALARIDLAARSASLLGAVEATLSARERGADPKRARLALGDAAAVVADHVGLRLAWAPGHGLAAEVSAPNLRLELADTGVPIVLPVVEPDGSVTLPDEAWDGVEALVAYLGGMIGGSVGDLVDALGWTPVAGPNPARLRLGDLVHSPDAALRAWLPRLAMSDTGARALALLADVFGGLGAARGVVEGSGRPEDPYRFALAEGLPNLAVWFPPEGLAPAAGAAADAIRHWQSGDTALPPTALAAALRAEAGVAEDIRALIEGRALETAFESIAQRWLGGDGRIVPPATAPAGITLHRLGCAAGQLPEQLDLAELLGRTPTTTVHVALGASAWPEAPEDRRIDLSSAGLDAAMFTLPAAGTGEWFVALGTRADCRAAGGASDGTPEQAARLGRVLDALAGVASDIAVVAVAGAGHAARLAAQPAARAAVTDLVLLGTPLAPISLTALAVQPTADALRLLDRLLPPADDDAGNADLALGRALVGALMELAPLADPAADLRPPVVPPEAPRAGLAVRALFGELGGERIAQALTAIVAAGIAARADDRAAFDAVADTLPSGVHAGLRWALPDDDSGTLRIRASAQLQLFGYELGGGMTREQALRVELRIGDALGWLAATPELELRALSAVLTLPLDGSSPGEARVVLHEARVFGQSWEALALGNLADDAMPVLPEARVLLSAAVQRLTADLGSARSLALSNLFAALGLTGANGGVVGDAVDQLVHDPAGLVRQRLAAAGAQLAAAVNTLLGPLGAGVDLAARTLRVQGSGTGRFGWQADVSASPAGLDGTLNIGPGSALPTVGGVQLRIALNPFSVALHWHQSDTRTEVVPLWPVPDGQALARLLAQAAPSLAAHVALELMRRADEQARPLIDAMLDALGMLAGAAADAERALRPLAGLLADPAGWLRSAGSLAANPLKIQALFDALRPLMGLAGAPGSPLALATGVSLAVGSDGGGARLALAVDPGAWAAPGGGGARLSGAIAASLAVGASGAPRVGLEAHLGLAGAAPGRQALHTRIGAAGVELFLRPASGADIALVPFAGLGGLAAAAEAALPFLLDKLAALPGTPGQLVQTLGDALALRSGTPKAFSAEALRQWAANPAGVLGAAVPSIAATGLHRIAPLLDDFLPAAVSASGDVDELRVSVAGVTLAWRPAAGRVALSAADIAVPGIERLGLVLAVSAAGLDELSVALGPARIAAGGVLLRPFASVAAGLAPAGGRRVMVGLSADDTHHFAARWTLDSASFDIVASDGALATAVASADPARVALRIVDIVADLVAAVAMAQQPVKDLLDTAVGAKNVRFLLQGVLLDEADTAQLVAGLFDPATLLARFHRLFTNIAGAGITITIDGFALSFLKHPATGTIGLQIGVVDRFALVQGDVSLWLENDDRWIQPDPPGDGGLFVGFIPPTLPLRFAPSLVVNGLGLRVGKRSGPLLDAGITLESVALHVFAAIDGAGANSGGVQLQFSNLAVSASGAGGNNGIAQGVMRDTGPTPPKPAFSPALAIQAHKGGTVQVSLSAGDGSGPWWIAIQKGFGPLYLEQIGFNATAPQGRLERISLLMDGSVAMFGLSCAVDDLQITYTVGNDDFFNPASWTVDLAGLAVSADMAGVSIAGGLLKQGTAPNIEYLGMLLGRFAVYGLTVYGGYGEGVADGQRFTAFFAVGAVNGPIGGPPAFFLTGIGGGFGINRLMRLPTDLAKFGDYPLIQALDIAAKPGNPMDQLRALGSYFPMKKGTFWFAAGLSFNSFALVDGIAVVGVQIGDGLDINLMGLARMALPRPQAAIVSIELALLVRFSSSEGVLWVQGQLTDNSWLLYPDVKLTGGFAYVIWFKGEKAGEFVLTLGGYHPDFHRDGYPVVPRLGLRWSIGGNIVIKAGTYFALTSEALMAGGDFEASAHFGPAWAEVKFGAHGIVYFDPFHYDVMAYARIAAGVTIDTWLFGEITISIHIGARIHVLGPEFRGSVTFEVGPIELTLRFGGSGREQKQPLAADAFVLKYLEAADSGRARAHALMTNSGALPAKGEQSTPDGSSARPFVVTVEFSMTFTSTVPAVRVTRRLAPATQPATTAHPPSRALGVAPMDRANVAPTLTIAWRRNGADEPYPFVDRVRPFGRFPAGIWGLPQDPNARKIPKGEMIAALSELELVCRAKPSPPGPEISYYQVEIGQRRPLPFTRRAAEINAQRSVAKLVSELLAAPAGVDAAFATAKGFLANRASPTALAALRGERQAPPRLGTLTEGLEAATPTAVPAAVAPPAPPVYDHFVDAPVVVGLLAGATVGIAAAAKQRTTVKGSERAWRTAPPTLAAVEAQRSRSIAARLIVTDTPAMSGREGGAATLIAAQSVPPSAVAHGATALVARRGAPLAEPLAAFADALAVGTALRGTARAGARARADAGPGAALATGQTVVLKLPNAHADAAPEGRRPRLAVGGAPARVVLLAHGGRPIVDALLGPQMRHAELEVPQGTERIVAIGQGTAQHDGARIGLAGWHAGMQLPYAGWSTAVGPGCVVRAAGERLVLHRERLDAGWVGGAELARGTSTVTTTFAVAARTVLIVLDDPAAAGQPVSARQLLLGLDGAARALDAAGNERAPVLLAMDNRSVLAYAVVPDGGDQPVVVSIASEQGWSLVGVMASAEVDATGAVALIASRGLDAAMQPFAVMNPAEGAVTSRLAWVAPTRSASQRAAAKALAQGGPAVPARKATKSKPRGQR
ncbi:DUF6603 domain-containing protein [Piscinibacter sp.]|uniref:DUF6603 domain-containing protein n=1 Tax=Piscinibacter sp. TaxID=1903157 RepID=UPI0039E4C4E3